MVDYEFEARVTGKVSAKDAEAARAMIARLLLCFGSDAYVFVKPEGETYKDLYDEIYKQTGYGKWYDRRLPDSVVSTAIITTEFV